MASAGMSAPGRARAGGVSSSDGRDPRQPADARFAWLSLFLAAWIFGGLILVIWALDNGLTNDIGASPYHVPFYTGLVALTAACLVLVRRAVMAGRRWHEAFPPGYGGLGAGLVVLLAWPIVDIGWRGGIGIPNAGIETMLAPSRLLLVAGAMLVASGPLRAALRSVDPAGGRWPAVLSAGLIYIVLGGAGRFQPAQGPWLESARFEPQSSYEIWVMNGDGSGQTRLIEAADGWEVGSPVWSPDGSQIAFTREKTPELAYARLDDVDVWLASADGTNQRLLIGGGAWQWLPHWSPDGAWITYTIDGPGGPGAGAGLRGSNSQFLLGQVFGQPPSVSPDVDVWRIRADGTGAPEKIIDGPADDRAGVYSPDGQHILFDSTRDGGHTAIFVAEADGSNPVRATFLGDDWGGTWSPDGTRIAFNSSPEGQAQTIHVATFPDTTRVTELPSVTFSDAAPSWSPDGTRIAFTSAGDGEIWSIAPDVPGGDLRNLSRSLGTSEVLAPGGGAWGPDGRILYERWTDPPATSTPLVRNDLAVAGMLLEVVFLVIVVLVIVRIGSPFGAVAVVMGLGGVFPAVDGQDWRFLPAAVIGGLIVDLLIRLAPAERRPAVAGAAAGVVYVLGAGLTVILTAGLGWTPSLLLGVAAVSAAIGWALAGVVGGPPATSATTLGG
jgi:WD40-like Beta Propeller Repeat